VTVTAPSAFSTVLMWTSTSPRLALGVSWPRYFHVVLPRSCVKVALAMPAPRPVCTQKSSSVWCIASMPSEPGITGSHQKWHEKNQSRGSTVLKPWPYPLPCSPPVAERPISSRKRTWSDRRLSRWAGARPAATAPAKSLPSSAGRAKRVTGCLLATCQHSRLTPLSSPTCFSKTAGRNQPKDESTS